MYKSHLAIGNLFRLNGGIVKQSNKLQNHSTLKLPCKKSPIGDSLSHLQNHTTLKQSYRVFETNGGLSHLQNHTTLKHIFS